MPSSAAFSFIRATKGTAPPMHSVTASAASLPELNSSPYSSVSSVSFSPGRRYMDEPSAMWPPVTVISCCRPPCSSATSAVISLVVLAMSILFSPFLSYSSLPLSASIRTAAAAETSTASVTAVKQPIRLTAAHSAASILRAIAPLLHSDTVSLFALRQT